MARIAVSRPVRARGTAVRAARASGQVLGARNAHAMWAWLIFEQIDLGFTASARGFFIGTFSTQQRHFTVGESLEC